MRSFLIISFAISSWASLVLIIRLWVRHQSDSISRKTSWSLLLLIPALGPLLYGALFRPLPPHGLGSSFDWGTGGYDGAGGGGGDGGGGHGHH
jgi:hypothetical protein